MDLSHKVAIVTGGASGIGIGTGRALAENGASVILCDRNESHAEDAATLSVCLFSSEAKVAVTPSSSFSARSKLPLLLEQI